jgi:3-oxoacyl-[acyl-carrier protein] reductase
MKLLDDWVALIIGSTKGNGIAMANLFSEHGANVIVTGRDKNEAESIADQLAIDFQTNSLGLKVDVALVTEVREMADKVRQKYGRIDVLINNAQVIQLKMSCGK